MKKALKGACFLTIIIFLSCGSRDDGGFRGTVHKTINLPQPETISATLSESIMKRRTTRDFDSGKNISLQQVSNILFAMQGLTKGSKRSVASAYGVYPLQLYLVTRNVEGLEDGMYKMNIPEFQLLMFKKGNFSSDISKACSGQSTAREAQLKVIITCVWDRLTGKMGEESKIWGFFEAGEATQNGFLAAAAMGLNTVPLGGIDPQKVAAVIDVEGVKETPVIVNCFGK